MKIGENGIIVFKMYDLDMTAVDKVIFTFRGIEKLEKDYPSAYVNYTDGRFYVGLTQEDTLILSRNRKVKVQAEAQICFKNGSVAKSDIIDFLLNDTLNTNVIPGNAPSDSVNEIEFRYENGIIISGEAGASPYDIAVKNGFNGTEEEWLESLSGEKGDDGVGITDITKTGTSGLIDTYTIELSDGSTKTFNVKNGADGDGADTLNREEILAITNRTVDDMYSSGVSVKNYGATGDGTTDDSQAFITAISNNDVVLLPSGTYNLNHVNITLDRKVTFVGEHAVLTSILNSNIYAPFGIECKNITFDGGTARTFESWAHVPSSNNGHTIILLTIPKAQGVDVVIDGCVFTNADYGIFAHVYGETYQSEGGELKYRTLETNTFGKNAILNSSFIKLNNAGIFHNTLIDYVDIKNCIFKEIGNRESISYPSVDMVSLGDLSNNSANKVTDCYIKDNYFDTLISGDDLTLTPHIFSANFIKVQGDNLSILSNTLKNKVGLCADSEAIYTKGQKVEIAFNTLENCFGGEGFICCKASQHYNDLGRIAYLHDNNIIGEYGYAFSVYGGVKIINNTINIKKMQKLVQAEGILDELEGNFEFSNNRVIGGTGSVDIHESFNHANNFMYIFKYPGKVVIKNNNIALIEDENHLNTPRVALKIQNITNDVNISNNSFALAVTGNLMEVSGTNVGESEILPQFVTSITIDILKNNFTSLTAISVGSLIFLNETLLSNMHINIEDNTIKSVAGMSNHSLFNIQVPEDNNDTLYYISNQSSDLVAPQRHIYSSNIKHVITNDVQYISAANADIESTIAASSDIDFGSEVI